MYKINKQVFIYMSASTHADSIQPGYIIKNYLFCCPHCTFCALLKIKYKIIGCFYGIYE